MAKQKSNANKPDFSEQDKNNQTTKRLFRSQSDQIIAGVCAGLADYFAIDVALVRLVFVLATIFGGFGVPVYIVLWIILPEDGSGDIASEDTVKKNVSNLKNRADSVAKGLSSDSQNRSRTIFGIILIGLGAIFFLDNFGIFRADIFWPLILIVVGFLILRS